VGPRPGDRRFRLRLSHQRFPAIIVYDRRAALKTYRGLTYFPIDLATGTSSAHPNPAQDTIVVMSTRATGGTRARGLVRRRRQGSPAGSRPCACSSPHGRAIVSVYFRDATSGRETYPLGRYVDAPRLSSGKYVLDFNTPTPPARSPSTTTARFLQGHT